MRASYVPRVILGIGVTTINLKDMVLALKGKRVIAQVIMSSMMSILKREVQVQGSMRPRKPTQLGRRGVRKLP